MTDAEKAIIKKIRTNCYGYIGSKELVDKATDDEILELVKLNDERARISNKIVDAINRIKVRKI